MKSCGDVISEITISRKHANMMLPTRIEKVICNELLSLVILFCKERAGVVTTRGVSF